MKNADRIVSAILGSAVLLVAVVAVLQSCGVGARAPDVETATALQRVCFSEEDTIAGNGCAAIWEVTLNRAAKTRRTPLEQLRAYSPEATATVPPRSPRQAWIQGLTLKCDEPPAWAAMNAERVARGDYPLPWETAWRPHCERRAAEAIALVVSPRRVCERTPDHFGGDCNVDANPHGVCDAVPPHWQRIDCGPAASAFYVVGPRPASMSPRSGDPTLPASIARGRR